MNDNGSAAWRKALAVWLTLGLTPAVPARTPGLLDASSPPGMHVSVGNHALHIHCTGRGSPAVVFEAGLGGTSLDWVRVQPRVARFTRSCSYDRAGYGWSESGPLPRDAKRLSDELTRLLVYASVQPPYVLVAHSFGGFPARLYAQENPRKVAGLVLVDTTHEQQFKRFSSGARKPLAPSGRSFVIANHWEVAAGLPEELKTLARSLALKPRAVRALYGELSEMRNSAVQVMQRPRLPSVPIHVVARFPRRISDVRALSDAEQRWQAAQRDLADRLPQASLHLAEGSGHHVQLDSPELVVDLVRAVVVGQRPARPCVAAPARRLLHGVRGGLGYRVTARSARPPAPAGTVSATRGSC